MTTENDMTDDELLEIELTAYALDELDADRRAAVEARLNDKPALRGRVADIRAEADAVGAAFANEPMPAAVDPPTAQSPWVRRGLAMAACLGLAGGTAWVLDLGVRDSELLAPDTPLANRPNSDIGTLIPPMVEPEATAGSDAEVRRLIVEAHELQTEAKYPEAIALLDQALAIEPANFTAKLMKEVVAAAKTSTEYRDALRSQRLSIAQTTALNLTDKSKYNDVLIYSEDWPELSESRLESLAGVSKQEPGRNGVVDNLALIQGQSTQSYRVPQHSDLRSAPALLASAAGGPAGGHTPVPQKLIRVYEPGEFAAIRLLSDQKALPEQLDLVAGQHEADFEWVESATPVDAFFVSPSNSETYAPLVDNPFRSPLNDPLSTFSIDVDTASYANVRRMLTAGQLPPADAVRIEEFVNTFDYGYAPPAADAEAPFATHVDVTAAPWAPEHRLVRIGLKGKEIATDDRPAANLVFLLDVSGSMKSAKKLPLVKDGLRKLVAALRMDDRIAIVVYAGASGLVLDSTSDHDAVLAAIDSLTPGGSTHGSAGIELAYDVATQHFIDGGLNRVVLCTDGDFNVGITDRSRLKTLIEEKAATGTYLSILGFGAGNLKDATMEELSNAGDGNYGYIDSPREAERLLAQQVNGTLLTIAKDVKIQVEFNPAKVASYRLIGYANRMLKKEDFNNDTVDAGDIGSGHTVTALYEVVPVGVAPPTPAVDRLKYAARPEPAAALANGSDELLTVKLRYKAPDAPKEQGTSKLLAVPVTDGGDGFDTADADARFAAAVAGFGMLLRQSEHAPGLNLSRVAEIARVANADFAGSDDERERREAFVGLVERAAAMAGTPD